MFVQFHVRTWTLRLNHLCTFQKLIKFLSNITDPWTSMSTEEDCFWLLRAMQKSMSLTYRTNRTKSVTSGKKWRKKVAISKKNYIFYYLNFTFLDLTVLKFKFYMHPVTDFWPQVAIRCKHEFSRPKTWEKGLESQFLEYFLHGP